MALIELSVLRDYWKNVSDWVTTKRKQQILTTTPLGISGVYTSSSIDSLTFPQRNLINCQVFADQNGTLYMEVSMDGTNWDYVQCSIPVLANVSAVMSWQNPFDRYYRFRYINGTIAQTVFRLSSTSN